MILTTKLYISQLKAMLRRIPFLSIKTNNIFSAGVTYLYLKLTSNMMYYLLGRNAIQSDMSSPTFRRNILNPSYALRTKKQHSLRGENLKFCMTYLIYKTHTTDVLKIATQFPLLFNPRSQNCCTSYTNTS